ncbi:MAG TPA: hypothetical protein DDX39_05810 [Bacteroidales bacterium]|nr:MAG: hypothetical protein A2W98_07080 [Bacteroidetes bacterium GWF2_33_38]OFY91980.1 MAG: hypothetical protein A2236_13650 [Bacteroidetes bacterium RIFOXYA2_FULL_33_7]HBF88140.1 hypothetical protein [Bacteroidales bacterium]
MKRIYLIITASIVILLLVDCKKGENDPFISLISRTSRLKGEWELVEVSENRDITYLGDHLYIEYSYSNSYITEKYTSSWSNDVETYQTKYNLSIVFEDDGLYNLSEEIEDTLYTIEGGWMWSTKSNELEVKKKEAIILFGKKFEIDKINEKYSNFYTGELNNGSLLYVDELRNNKLVIKTDNTYKNESGFEINHVGYRTYEKIK